MPCFLEAPLLKVDAEAIHRLDTRDVKNLFSVWTVFARCADSVSHGRRLENLSWRLWTRETFCVEPGTIKGPFSATSLPQDIQTKPRPSSDDLPQLSGSVDSVADDEAVEFTSESSPLDIDRPRIQRQDSCASSRSRGKERHITSDDFEKMVASIVQTKEPLVAPFPMIAMPLIVPDALEAVEPTRQSAEQTMPEPAAAPTATLERSGSTSESEACKSVQTLSVKSSSTRSTASSAGTRSLVPTHTVVRGFSVSHIPIVPAAPVPQPKLPALDAIPEPTSSPAAMHVQPKKQQAKFALGGSSSCDDSLSDQGTSPGMHRQVAPQAKRKMFLVGGSSEDENSLKSAMHSSRSGVLSQKKQASFSKQLETTIIAVNDQSETEGEDLDESAIDDDDDSSDWEDSNEDSNKSSVDDKTFFQRVDSKVNLTSRRSLITLMLEKNERQSKLGNMASQSTSAIHQSCAPARQGPAFIVSPNDSDDSPLMMKRGVRAAHLKPINEVPRTAAQPIMTPAMTSHQQAALSPRTTRRNMLSMELTQSLRRHLVWERSQKSSTVNAVLKRRHTSQDVANLKQYPEPVVLKKDTDVNATSWDQYITRDTFGGYHSKGW